MPLEDIAPVFFPGMDIVLADGYARSSAPRIIACTSPGDAEGFAGGGEVVALVDASEGNGLDGEEVKELAGIVLEFFGI